MRALLLHQTLTLRYWLILLSRKKKLGPEYDNPTCFLEQCVESAKDRIMYIDGEFNIKFFYPFAKTIINLPSLIDSFIDFKERFDLGFYDHTRVVKKVTIMQYPVFFHLFIALLCLMIRNMLLF